MVKGAHPSQTTPLVTQRRPQFPLNAFPESTHPYLELMRLDKPTGTWLVFWPFAWGLTMAAFHRHLRPEQYAVELMKAYLVAFIMRSFACTVNDICDYEFDRQVERTKSRPLASGRVSYKHACFFAMAQLIVATTIFFATMSWFGFIAAMVQLLPLSCLYPLMKRITYWPQAWLGIAINFGFVISWVDVTQDINLPLTTSMLGSLWAWTILYDTVYACQDKADDIKAGVRSTALLFGSYIRPLLTGFGLAFVTTLAYSGVYNNQGLVFFVVSVGGTFVHLIWQYVTVNLDDPRSCKINFVRNGQLGWIVWGGIVSDYIIRITPLSSWIPSVL